EWFDTFRFFQGALALGAKFGQSTIKIGNLMRNKSAAFLGLVILCLSALGADKQSEAHNQTTSLIGTWELVSEKWNDAKEFTAPPTDRKALKFITATHFIWVHVNPTTKEISNSMGGT